MPLPRSPFPLPHVQDLCSGMGDLQISLNHGKVLPSLPSSLLPLPPSFRLMLKIHTHHLQRFSPLDQHCWPLWVETQRQLKKSLQEEMREMEKEKENLESTLGWGSNELPSDIHNMLGCIVCHVGGDGTWVYCLDSLFHPLHPSHLCLLSQGCYCK